MMNPTLFERFAAMSSRLAAFLTHARAALAGEQSFGPQDAQRLAAPLAEMEPVVARAVQQRQLDPELHGALERYATQLGEVGTVLEQVRAMLLARRAALAASRAQLEAAAQWAATYRQTR